MSAIIPTPEVFFLETPPYAQFEIIAANLSQVAQIELFEGTLDTYCVECGKSSVFKFQSDGLPRMIYSIAPSRRATGPQGPRQSPKRPVDAQRIEAERWQNYSRVLSVLFECTRNTSHILYFFVRIQDAKLIKIGQYPSLADLQHIEIEKYRKLLGEDSYVEFNRAVGLFSHGVGIGAFVYLRRIFENLIEEAHTKASQDSLWVEDSYVRGRTEEKIKLLQNYLPTFLVNNWSIYSILSKGIHELTEKECLEYFQPIHLGIKLILDEKLQQAEREKNILQAQKAIADIKNKLRS